MFCFNASDILPYIACFNAYSLVPFVVCFFIGFFGFIVLFTLYTYLRKGR